jgi:hypothetical protein
MKKLLIAVIATLSLSAVAFAATRAPRDISGNQLSSLDYLGADGCRFTSASSTNATLCENEAGMVYGVVVSSCAVSNYVVLRDSATANTSSTPMLTVWCEDSGADEDGTMIHKLPVPLKFGNGLSANMSSALTGVGEVVVITRPRTATE